MVAYINGALSRRAARLVAEHLQVCDRCHASYVQQRDAAAHLKRELTLFGTPSSAHLETIWAEVEPRLHKKVPLSRQPIRWRQGLVGVAFAVLCVVPWAFSVDEIVAASGALPVVPAEMPQSTPARTDTHVAPDSAHRRVVFRPATENPQPPTPTSTPAVVPAPDKRP